MNDMLKQLKDYVLQRKFGSWTIEENGDLIHTNGYYILKNNLADSNWISHMSKKTMYWRWIDLNEFIPAYIQALKFLEIEKIEIDIF